MKISAAEIPLELGQYICSLIVGKGKMYYASLDGILKVVTIPNPYVLIR